MKDVVKKIIIEGEFGKKPEKITEINYNTLPSVEILSRIRAYEAQHKTYETLASRLDCGESSFEELTALGDWELLIKE
ncbi:MAG: hypothetical protein QW666_03040, partial [Candidatus Woesearchaeota archaeon]